MPTRSIWHAPRAAAIALLLASGSALAAPDPLPSWNDGPAKTAIERFVEATVTPGNPRYVAREARIAVFDQDGTLWVEHPMYSQVIYSLDRVPALVKAKPELAGEEPFKTVMTGDMAKIAKLPLPDLEKILAATLTGMTTDEFNTEVSRWISAKKDKRWNRLYTQLTYAPMQEMMRYLRSQGYRTYIVTGGGQDFVRVYADQTYGVPPEQVVGSAGSVKYGYDASGKPVFTKEPRLLLDNNNAGKPEGIHLMIGRRPIIAFGNTAGDQQMLEYTTGGYTPGMGLLVLHDDAAREYAYGPATGLPDTKVGTFSQELYDKAKASGWTVISMKNDWKTIFANK